jgi:hypothetical protein
MCTYINYTRVYINFIDTTGRIIKGKVPLVGSLVPWVVLVLISFFSRQFSFAVPAVPSLIIISSVVISSAS